jgi:hypothetical protein
MARRRAPVPSFPAPPERYDQVAESQFRLAVQQAIQQAVAFITGVKSGTPAALAAGNIDDYDIGPDTDFLRLTAHASNSALRGMTHGRDARRLVVVNIGSGNLTIEHENAGSTAENRTVTPTLTTVTLAQWAMAEFIYDAASSRWRLMGTAV